MKLNPNIDNLIIREASEADITDIFSWRNNIQTRRMFINQEKILIDDHKEWFSRNLFSNNVKMYISIIDGIKLGICIFKISLNTKKADISINLNPKMRGKKLSFFILDQSIKKYISEENFSKLEAKIKLENTASLKIFRKCKFILKKQDDEFYYLSR